MHWNYYRYVSIYNLITQFLLLVSKNSILICWNVHLEDYFEGWIWLKDIILLYSLFILSLSIINIYVSMYMFFANIFSKSWIIHCFTLSLQHSRIKTKSLILNWSKSCLCPSIQLKVVYNMNKIRLPPVLCCYEVDVS